MTVPTPPSVVPTFDYATISDLRARADRPDGTRWLWDGYLAAGNVTLPAARGGAGRGGAPRGLGAGGRGEGSVTLRVGGWRAGKAPLRSVVGARWGAGGALAGGAGRRGGVVVLTRKRTRLNCSQSQ